MRVLLFTLEYPPFKGGVAKYYSDIVEHWPADQELRSPAGDRNSAAGDEIFVLDNNGNSLIKPTIWPHWLPALYRLVRTVRKKKIDHVLVGHILPLGTAAWLASIFMKFDYSVFLHGVDINYAYRVSLRPGSGQAHIPSTRLRADADRGNNILRLLSRSSRKRWLTKIILKSAKNIICNSNYSANITRKILDKKFHEKIIVVNPGVDYPKFDMRYAPALSAAEGMRDQRKNCHLENKFIIFSLGRLVKRKGFDTMIEAMPYILEEHPNTVYIIAGAGLDEDYLKGIINDLPEAARGAVRLIGPVSEDDKWAWLRACDIFAMPNRDIENGKGIDAEGFGIVYLEANLAGKPVIAGEAGGTDEAVIDHESGIIVDGDSADAVADGAIELLRDPMLRLELGEEGMRRALREFNVKNQVGKIYNIINEQPNG